MPRPSANLTERFEMRASEAWIERLDEWRRQQPEIPSRGDAIRTLVDQALGSSAPAKTGAGLHGSLAEVDDLVKEIAERHPDRRAGVLRLSRPR
jgi:hypothetical protein